MHFHNRNYKQSSDKGSLFIGGGVSNQHTLLTGQSNLIEVLERGETAGFQFTVLGFTDVRTGHSCFDSRQAFLMVLNTEWVEVEEIVIEADPSQYNNFGFGITGSKSSGAIVRYLTPNGLAAADGRLQTGDHIVAINGYSLRGLNSGSAAKLLRNTMSPLSLLVARPIKDIGTRILKDKLALRNRSIRDPTVNVFVLVREYHHKIIHNDFIIFNVTLDKGLEELGFTAARLVNGAEEDSVGLFVTKIEKEMLVDIDGRIQVGDELQEVNGVPVENCTIEAASILLKQPAHILRLKLKRRTKQNVCRNFQKSMSSPNLQHYRNQVITASDYQCGDADETVSTATSQQHHQTERRDLQLEVIDDRIQFSVESAAWLTPGEQHRQPSMDGSSAVTMLLLGDDGQPCFENPQQQQQQQQHLQAGSTRNDRYGRNDHSGDEKRIRTCSNLARSKSLVVERICRSKEHRCWSKPCCTETLTRSHSLQMTSQFMMWCEDVITIELQKSTAGFGFSLLSFRDSAQSDHITIVVRSVVPGAVAHRDGRMFPGDRLVSVNDQEVDYMSLEDTLDLLRSVQAGCSASIGILKPLLNIQTDDHAPIDNSRFTNKTPSDLKHAAASTTSTTTTNAMTIPTAKVLESIASSAPVLSSPCTDHPPDIGKCQLHHLKDHDTTTTTITTTMMTTLPTLEEVSDNLTPVADDAVFSEAHLVPGSSESSTADCTIVADVAQSTNEGPREKALLRDDDPEEKEEEEEEEERHCSESTDGVKLTYHSPVDSVPKAPENETVSTETTVGKMGRTTYGICRTCPDGTMKSSWGLKGKGALSGITKTIAFNVQSLERSSQTAVVSNGMGNTTNVIDTTTTSASFELVHNQKLHEMHKGKRKPSESTGSSPASRKSGRMRTISFLEDFRKVLLPEYVNFNTPALITNNKEVTRKLMRIGMLHCLHEKMAHEIDATTYDSQIRPLIKSDMKMYTVRSDYLSMTPSRRNESSTTSSSCWFCLINKGQHAKDLIHEQHLHHHHQCSCGGPCSKAKKFLDRDTSRSREGYICARVKAFLTKDVIKFPRELEKNIKIKKLTKFLGLSVNAYAHEGVNGCLITSLMPGSAVERDGRLFVSDYITVLNNESMKAISAARAKTILRRASLIHGWIDVTYMSHKDTAFYEEYFVNTIKEVVSTKSLNSLVPEANSPHTDNEFGLLDAADCQSVGKGVIRGYSGMPSKSSRLLKSFNQLTQYSDSIFSRLLWTEPTVVHLNRAKDGTLGFIVVGGRLDVTALSPVVKQIQGLFIKDVSPDRLDDIGKILRSGDRILKIDDQDVETAGYDQSIDMLRTANSPIVLKVQRLIEPIKPVYLSRGGKSASGCPTSTITWASSSSQCRRRNLQAIVKHTDADKRRSTSTGRLAVQATSDVCRINGRFTGPLDSSADEDISEIPHDQEFVGRLILEQKETTLNALSVDRKDESIMTEDDNVTETIERLEDQVQKLLEGERGSDLDGQFDPLDGHIIEIDVYRSSIDEPIGLSLVGSSNPSHLSTFVCGIFPGSPAFKSSKFEFGDEILQVNDTSLQDRCHVNTTPLIKSISSNHLKFIVRRTPNHESRMALGRHLVPVSQKHNTLVIPTTRMMGNISLTPSPADTSLYEKESWQDEEKEKNTNKPMSNSADASDGRNSAAIEDVINKLLKPPFSLVSIVEEYEQISTPLTMRRPRSLVAKERASVPNGHVSAYRRKSPRPSSPAMADLVYQQQQQRRKPIASISMKNVLLESMSADATTVEDPNDPTIRPVLIGATSLIEIDKKGHASLGISIVGGAGSGMASILVHDIYEGGSVHQDGRIAIGDQLMEANGVDICECTCEEVMELLMQTTGPVRLKVMRNPENVLAIEDEQDKLERFEITLMKKPSKGFGFSVVGRRSGKGAYVSCIIEGGTAEKRGHLKPGDLILEINQRKVTKLPYSEIVYLLKTCPAGMMFMMVGRLKPSGYGLSESHHLASDYLAQPISKPLSAMSAQQRQSSPGLSDTYPAACSGFRRPVAFPGVKTGHRRSRSAPHRQHASRTPASFLSKLPQQHRQNQQGVNQQQQQQQQQQHRHQQHHHHKRKVVSAGLASL